MYEWKQKEYQGGGIEWKLDCPLRRRQFRPTVTCYPGQKVVAVTLTGYAREFDTVEAAKEWAGNVSLAT